MLLSFRRLAFGALALAAAAGVHAQTAPPRAVLPDGTVEAHVPVAPAARVVLDGLTNGGFEDGTTAPDAWTASAWNAAAATHTWDTASPHGGARSVRIQSTAPNDASWAQTVAVEPNASYRLSGWIRTSGVAPTAETYEVGASLSLAGTYTHTPPLRGDNGWTYREVVFSTDVTQTQVTVAARVGYWYGATTGTAWYDDVRLERLPDPGRELLNASFEDGVSAPDAWFSQPLQGTASFPWDAGRTGGRAAGVSAGTGAIARWSQTVLVDPDAEYELAGWIRTSGATGAGGRIGVNGVDTWLAAATPGQLGTQGWTYASVRFVTGSASAVRVLCSLGEADPLYVRSPATGTVWCDDLALTRVRGLSRRQASGQHVALDVYAETFGTFSDVGTYLGHMDAVYNAMADLVGGTPYGGATITVRQDYSFYYGLLSGNPVRIGPGLSWPSIVNAFGVDFGVSHELGHDFDSVAQGWRYYTTAMPFGNAEHWANLKVLHAYDVLGAAHPALTMNWQSTTVPLGGFGTLWVQRKAEPWIASGQTDLSRMDNDTFSALLYTIVQRYGWAPFRYAFRTLNTRTGPPPADDLGKVQLLAQVLSTGAGVDLRPTFASWGFPIAVAGETGAESTFALAAPVPNPSHGAVALRYSVPSAGTATLAVYDVLGRRVATLADGEVSAGHHEARLDAGTLAPGVYVVRLASGGHVFTRRLTVAR